MRNLHKNEERGYREAASETVFMFSGQGSQHFQMGRELFEKNKTFRNWMMRLDEIPREMCGESIVKVLYSDHARKGDSFNRTLHTHPAIFMVEYALAGALIEAGVRPDMVMGVSLGSFAAAAVAGFVEPQDALISVLQQAIAFEEHCEFGGMTAVLANTAIYFEDILSLQCELAAVSFPSHFVVSAKLLALDEVEAVLQRRSVTFQRLPVSFPFHSRWIDQAEAPFLSFMKTVKRKQGMLPLVCCEQSEIVSQLSDNFFWNVARRPIRFYETASGLERRGTHRYIDVGPGSTLATFLKYGLPATTKSTVHSILTPFGFDQKNLAAVTSLPN